MKKVAKKLEFSKQYNEVNKEPSNLNATVNALAIMASDRFVAVDKDSEVTSCNNNQTKVHKPLNMTPKGKLSKGGK